MSLPPFCLDEDAVLKDLSSEIRWRRGMPNYDKAKALFRKYRTKDHPCSALEFTVQNIVKNWEKGLYISSLIFSSRLYSGMTD